MILEYLSQDTRGILPSDGWRWRNTPIDLLSPVVWDGWERRMAFKSFPNLSWKVRGHVSLLEGYSLLEFRRKKSPLNDRINYENDFWEWQSDGTPSHPSSLRHRHMPVWFDNRRSKLRFSHYLLMDIWRFELVPFSTRMINLYHISLAAIIITSSLRLTCINISLNLVHRLQQASFHRKIVCYLGISISEHYVLFYIFYCDEYITFALATIAPVTNANVNPNPNPNPNHILLTLFLEPNSKW